MKEIKLTQYSRSAGCGCKIEPKVLNEILEGNRIINHDERIIIANSGNEDAAVYQISEDQYLISSTDFFTPIIDDPFIFGQVAAANAISDIYAMGATPIFALAILGWPVSKLTTEIAQLVLKGAQEKCREAGITLAGGHSIETSEPIFGLSVNGLAQKKNIKRNDNMQPGDLIYLTKPIGVGILSAAHKRELISEEDYSILVNQLVQLNNIGEKIGALDYVTSMTDVTGFGIIGHLTEMCNSAHKCAELYFDNIPVISGADTYMKKNCIPDATYKNWNAYSANVKIHSGVNVMAAFQLLPDPQTNGGLLFTVSQEKSSEIKQFLEANNYGNFAVPVGRVLTASDYLIQVHPNMSSND